MKLKIIVTVLNASNPHGFKAWCIEVLNFSDFITLNLYNFDLFFCQNLADIDETLVERLVGLTEMFPESVRSGTIATARGVLSGAKWLYSVSGKTVWILSTSFVILALPVIFEVERVQTEEAQLQQQRQVSVLASQK